MQYNHIGERCTTNKVRYKCSTTISFIGERCTTNKVRYKCDHIGERCTTN